MLCFQISGRELFEFNPDLVQGDDEEADEIEMEREKDEDDEEDEVQVYDITDMNYIPTEADSSGTQASADRFPEMAPSLQDPLVNGADIEGEFFFLLRILSRALVNIPGSLGCQELEEIK